MGKNIGPINSLVLSRSESDNVYIQDKESIDTNGLCELKISDNQIMNQNDRSDYLQGIFDNIKGIEFYLNDFTSTGIMYYELLDRYNVKIGDNTYSCVMFNDEQDITQGLEEQIYTEKPESSETDYTKADKTDQKINQTNLIVDKQNQSIQALVTSNTELINKTSQLEIAVDKIEGEIGEIADVTTTIEGYHTLEVTDINESEPILVRIYPAGEDIIPLRPKIGLYPRVGLYPHKRELIFTRTDNPDEPYSIEYNIPKNLYRLDKYYDEFVMNYETQECYIQHRIGIDENGEKYLLQIEEKEVLDYPVLRLLDGNYTISMPAFDNAYIYMRLMAKNIYTSQFATKVELNSKITQTSSEINLSVDKKLESYSTKQEMNAAIKITADGINSEVSKKVGEDEIISSINQSAEAVQINANKISLEGKTINLTSDDVVISSNNFNVTKNGNVTANSANLNNVNINNGAIVLETNGYIGQNLKVIESSVGAYASLNSNQLNIHGDGGATSSSHIYLVVAGKNIKNSYLTLIGPNGYTNVSDAGITTPFLTQTSLEENKKNIEKLEEKAIDIIKNIDIYKYNLKFEEDTNKKHIGFVIGDNYNYAKEVTNNDNTGVDDYSFISLCCKAIQEQQEQIDNLQNKLKKLEEREENKNG